MFGFPYVIFLTTLAILGYLVYRFRSRGEEEYIKFCYLAGFGLILFFVGMRGLVMYDWRNYYSEFMDMTLENQNVYGISRELGWTVFVLLCKNIYDNYYFMVFVHTILQFALWINFFRKYSSNILWALVLYFAFEGFGISFNLMRNSIAMGFFLNAIPYISKREPVRYYLWCGLAVLFHYSALFYLPLYWFMHFKAHKYVFLGILLSCSTIYCLNIPIFEKLAEMLLGGNSVAEKAVELYTKMSHQVKLTPIFFERIGTGILIFCYYDKIHELQKDSQIFINAFLLYIACTFLFSDFSVISDRLSFLFVFSYWILYPCIVRSFSIPNNRRLFLGFLSLYVVFRTVMPMRSEIYQYENIMFGARSFNERAAMFDRLNVDD